MVSTSFMRACFAVSVSALVPRLPRSSRRVALRSGVSMHDFDYDVAIARGGALSLSFASATARACPATRRMYHML